MSFVRARLTQARVGKCANPGCAAPRYFLKRRRTQTCVNVALFEWAQRKQAEMVEGAR